MVICQGQETILKELLILETPREPLAWEVNTQQKQISIQVPASMTMMLLS